MSQPFFVSHDGVPLVLDKPKPPSPASVEDTNKPLWKIAEEEAKKQSTQKETEEMKAIHDVSNVSNFKMTRTVDFVELTFHSSTSPNSEISLRMNLEQGRTLAEMLKQIPEAKA